MDDSWDTHRMDEEGKMVSSDSAYMSSTEDGQTPTPITYPYNEELTHKTILVGDSGVGKTSLLVQFDQGKFIAGSFTSTVGIGFTSRLSAESLLSGRQVETNTVCCCSWNLGRKLVDQETQE
ncbi:unnamed protein product [Oreochromis niloticus]|nr:unnamed protein product [Mustela putorius furo]